MLERETIQRHRNVSFYFDPICPWTWITSRWLVEVVHRKDIHVDWRSLSLVILNNGEDALSLARSGAARLSTDSLRMIEAMRADGREDLVGPFYTALGTRLHVEGEPPVPRTLEAASRDVDASGYLAATEDGRWDDALIRSTAEAMQLGGPDTGSPVLRLGRMDHGTHGPIVSPAPEGDDALRLWDVVTAALTVPGFYELKHGREGAPQITQTPAHAEAR
jgi:2-hydroxychromene-2-carboxylate isomerase